MSENTPAHCPVAACLLMHSPEWQPDYRMNGGARAHNWPQMTG